MEENIFPGVECHTTEISIYSRARL